jgi:hypothetical protein
MTHEEQIRQLCVRMGVAYPRLQRLRVKFTREHGDEGEAKLAEYLEGIWEELRDEPRIPARQAGLVHPEQYVPHPARALPDEPEAVPEEYQAEISRRAREGFDVLRQDERERQELHRLGTRIKDLAKRAPVGTDFAQAIEAMKQGLEGLEQAVEKAA